MKVGLVTKVTYYSSCVCWDGFFSFRSYCWCLEFLVTHAGGIFSRLLHYMNVVGGPDINLTVSTDTPSPTKSIFPKNYTSNTTLCGHLHSY